ncbi:MAG TPA: FimV/HubP family polar landmark protein, partial [Woeseiaceae bacterium]|nr:FimV/HubP family polar landmark protein [Woeseiaceae bacterium]
GQVSDIVDLEASDSGNEQSGIDFLFDEELGTGASTTRAMPDRSALDSTAENPTVESPAAESAIESPTEESTVESPTVESTIESPTIEQASGFESETDFSTDATAEIDLDDLGLDLQDLAASGLGDLDGDMTGGFGDLDRTTDAGAPAANDDDEATGPNVQLDDDFDFDEALAATSEMPSLDEATGKNPAVAHDSDTDVDFDVDAILRDATGQTQVLTEDTDVGEETTLRDDDQTQLADAGDEDHTATAALSDTDLDTDFDFAKTEALPGSAFDKNATGEMPGLADDVELDLDLDPDLNDLTAALRVSEGDTVDQPRDDGTVERPRVQRADVVDLDFGDLMGDAGGDESDDMPTEALAPDDFSDDLHEARTMTEVGTKLDLARAYVDMGDPEGARSILEEVLEEGDDGQRQQARNLIESLPA